MGDVCPDCGSTALTEKGVDIDGDRAQLSSSWDYCLNCGWEDQ